MSPLSGVVVVEFGASKAVKLATRFLAGYGADVRIAVSGDADGLDDAERLYFDAAKGVVDGDLIAAVAAADVLVTDRTVHARELAGLEPALLAASGTIVVAVTPYGESGPGAERPASALTQFASGGQMASLGDRDREPLQAYGNQGEAQAALHVVGAVLAALVRRARFGIADSAIDISVQEAQASALELFGGAAFNGDVVPDAFMPRPNGSSMHALWAMYEVRDGLVGVHVNAPNMVPFLAALGRPDLLERTGDMEFLQSDELRAVVADWVRPLTKAEFMEIAAEHGVPFSYVAEPDDLLASEIVASTGLWREVTASDGRTVMVPGPMNESELVFDVSRAR